MAIASFLVEVRPEHRQAVAAALAALPGVELADRENALAHPHTLVVVVEAPHAALPQTEARLLAVPGVLAVIAAYLNLEDELPTAGQAAG